MKDFLKGLVVAAAASAFIFFGAIGVEQTAAPHVTPAPLATAAPSYGAFNPTGGGTYYLSSTISSSQTTIKLSSFTEPTSNVPYTMAYLNSSIEYATIAPQTSQSEFISFTGITQNSDGSATLTGVVRGLARSYPYTASATFALPHAGQSRFILSDAPQVFNSYASLSNAQTFTAVNTFGSTTPPQYDADPVWANFSTQIFADVSYVNSVVAAGAANASETVKGIIQLATGAQAALGTSLGSTGARLALGNNLATSTPNAAACGAGCIPVAVNGKLLQTFWDLTQSFTWSGAQTFTSTVNIIANASNKLTLNGLAYTWQSTRAASSTVASEDGNGNITFNVQNYSLLNNLPAFTGGTTTVTISPNTLVGNKKLRLAWANTIPVSKAGLVQIGNGSSTTTLQTTTNGQSSADLIAYPITSSSQFITGNASGGYINSSTSLNSANNIYIAFGSDTGTFYGITVTLISQ